MRTRKSHSGRDVEEDLVNRRGGGGGEQVRSTVINVLVSVCIPRNLTKFKTIIAVRT